MTNETISKLDDDHVVQPDPTHCDTCHVKLDEVGYVQYFNAHKCARTLCRTCDLERRFDDFARTGQLTSWLVQHCQIEDGIMQARKEQIEAGRATRGEYRPISGRLKLVVDAAARIQPDITAFERDVWFGGLAEQARTAKTKGMSAKADGLTFLSFTMCGRARFQIERDGEDAFFVCIQGLEDGSPAHIRLHGIDATEEQACVALRMVRTLWTEGKLEMAEDRNVSV